MFGRKTAIARTKDTVEHQSLPNIFDPNHWQYGVIHGSFLFMHFRIPT